MPVIWERRFNLFKLLILSVCVMTAVLAFLPSKAYAIANPDAIAIYEPATRVFQNVFETGDMLFITRYNVEYGVTPTEDPEASFTMSLYGTDGTTLITQRGIPAYGYNLVSIYQTATQAAALTWGSTYWVKIMGSPALFGTLTENTNYVQVQLSNPNSWIIGTADETEDYLYIHCVNVAEDIEIDAVVTWLATTSSGEVLNTTGRLNFLAAIPGLNVAVPGLFQANSETIEIEHTASTGAYAATLDMPTMLGVDLNAAFEGIGDWLNISGQMVGAIFIALIMALVAGLVYIYTGNGTAAMVISLPILIIGAWLGMVPLAIFFTIIICVVAYMGYHLYLRQV